MKKKFKFLNKFIKVFNKYYPFSAIVLFVLIVGLAYWQLVNLYFWTDDWDLFLKIIHPELGLWGMDPGWFGSGPYRYLHTPFMPFYPIFKLNAAPYFAGEILAYFIATISSFLLFIELTRKKALAIGAAVIYASLGYIGSYTIFHLSNAFQNLGAVIFTNLSLWILAKHYRTSKSIYYFLSILLFYASLEIENLRAHGLIFLVLGLTILYVRWKKPISNILLNLVKLVPFVLIYKNLYSASLGSGSSTTVGAFFHTMVRDKVYAYFINPFASFSNVIIPDNITKLIYSLFGNSYRNIVPEMLLVLFFIVIGIFSFVKSKRIFQKVIFGGFIFLEILYFFFNRWALQQPILLNLDIAAGFTSMLGMTMLLFFLLVSIRLWKTANIISKAILFGIILIFGHYIGYFIGIPSYSYLMTTDRYLTPSTVGTAILLSALFYLAHIKKINLFVGLITIYSLYLIVLMNITVSTVANDISKPTKRIYDNIRKITPSIPKNSILLLDVENGSNLRYLVGSSFPSTAFALFYGFPNRVPAVRSFDEYLYDVKTRKMKLDDLQSFYIGQWKIIDTTKDVKSLLKNPTSEKILDLSKWTSNTLFANNNSSFNTSTFIAERKGDTLGVNPQINATIGYTSVVPSLLSLTITTSPTTLDNKKFPYHDVSKSMTDEIVREDLANLVVENSVEQSSCKDVPLLIAIDKEHREFINTANIDVTSQTKYSEKEFLHDGLLETNWSGHVLDWARQKRAEVTLDLGILKSVNALIWVNYLKRTTPTQYSILGSEDGKNWKNLKEVSKGPGRLDGEFVLENFSQTNARYIKMVITDILIGNAPAISEIWTSSLEKTGDLSNFSRQLIDNPMLCPLRDNNEYISLVNSLDLDVKSKIWWLTDSWENFSENNSKDFNLIADGQPHTYNIFIPAQGTTLEKIMINNFQLPINLAIQKASIRSMTFKEIDEMGYISMPTGSTN